MNQVSSMKDSPKIELFMVSEKSDGREFYPKTIPRRRTRLFSFITLFSLLCLFLVSIIWNRLNHVSFYSKLCTNLIGIMYGLMFLLGSEILYRVRLLVEEYLLHFSSRYSTSYKRLFNHIFNTPYLFHLLVFLFVSINFISTFVEHDNAAFIDDVNWNTFLLFVIMFFLWRELNFQNAPIYHSWNMGNYTGLDYGSAIANSFYHGYLYLIMRDTGEKLNKNLIQCIENYCASHRVEIPVKKLFILIPKSCECPVSLKNERFPDIEESSSLEEKIQTVAAVQNRVYKNSVYKINDKKSKRRVYVCVEYATPLHTFHRTLKYSGVHSEILKQHKEDIVFQFYQTLKKLLRENPNIGDCCELIYYDDVDENGKFRDVAQIVLKRVRQLERMTKKSI